MNKKLIKLLSNKANTRELAHLYLIEPNKADYQGFCYSWCYELIEKILGTSLPENSPDILFLQTVKDAKQYTKEHIKEIYDFTNYKATQLPQKYIIISEAHKLTENNYNKLLKTFEEPPIDLTVFLINPHKVNLLATIESRAIKIKIFNKEKKHDNFLSSILDSELGFTGFCEKLDENKETLHQTLSELIELFCQSQLDVKTLSQMKEDIKAFEQDILFNNSSHSMRLRVYNSFIKLI